MSILHNLFRSDKAAKSNTVQNETGSYVQNIFREAQQAILEPQLLTATRVKARIEMLLEMPPPGFSDEDGTTAVHLLTEIDRALGYLTAIEQARRDGTNLNTLLPPNLSRQTHIDIPNDTNELGILPINPALSSPAEMLAPVQSDVALSQSASVGSAAAEQFGIATPSSSFQSSGLRITDGYGLATPSRPGGTLSSSVGMLAPMQTYTASSQSSSAGLATSTQSGTVPTCSPQAISRIETGSGLATPSRPGVTLSSSVEMLAPVHTNTAPSQSASAGLATATQYRTALPSSPQTSDSPLNTRIGNSSHEFVTPPQYNAALSSSVEMPAPMQTYTASSQSASAESATATQYRTVSSCSSQAAVSQQNANGGTLNAQDYSPILASTPIMHNHANHIPTEQLINIQPTPSTESAASVQQPSATLSFLHLTDQFRNVSLEFSTQSRMRMECDFCKALGHGRTHCRKLRYCSKQCQHCGKIGHSRKKCFSLKGITMLNKWRLLHVLQQKFVEYQNSCISPDSLIKTEAKSDVSPLIKLQCSYLKSPKSKPWRKYRSRNLRN